jgi:hypothetical protein
MRCASSCVSPCRSPLVGWGMNGGNGGVVTGRGDVWFEGRAIVRWCDFGRRINGVVCRGECCSDDLVSFGGCALCVQYVCHGEQVPC